MSLENSPQSFVFVPCLISGLELRGAFDDKAASRGGDAEERDLFYMFVPHLETA